MCSVTVLFPFSIRRVRLICVKYKYLFWGNKRLVLCAYPEDFPIFVQF